MATEILKSITELQQWQLVEDNLLTKDQLHTKWYSKVHFVYKELIETHDLEYRPYQPEYAAMYCNRRNNILGLSMGVSKTIISLLTVAAVYDNMAQRRPGTVHICVPDVLAASRWVEDINRIDCLKDHYELIHNAAQLCNATKPILIYSFDFLRRQMPVRLPRINSGRRSTNGGHKLAAEFLAQYFKPNMLIVDEAHNITDSSQRSKLLQKLRRKSKRCLALSGTVSDGSLKSVHTLCKFTYGRLFPYQDYKVFREAFSSSQKIKTNYLSGSVTAAADKWLETLNSGKISEYYYLMRSFIHRARLSDPQIAQFITLPEEKTHYHRLTPPNRMVVSYVQEVNTRRNVMQAVANADGVQARAAALRLMHPLINLVNCYEPDPLKLKQLLELINQAEGSVAIFVNRVNAGDFICRKMQEANVSPIYMNSEVAPTERVNQVVQFQSNPKSVGVFSINLAATAIDLTTASDVIFYDLPWQIRQIQQAAARAIRPGNRHKTVKVHYLYHLGLIDEHQVELAKQKLKGCRLTNDFEVLESQEGVYEDGIGADLSPISALREILSASLSTT